jgi:hypothetical protein
MSLDVKVVNLSIGTAGTPLAITGVGFQPKAVIFISSGRTSGTDGGAGADSRTMFGFAAATTGGGGTKQRCSATIDLDGVTSFSHSSANRSDACIAALTTAGAVDGLASLGSFDADGFTLNRDNPFSVDIRVTAICYGGADITNIEIGTHNTPTAGTEPFTEDITAGFTCTDDDAIGFLIGCRGPADNGTANDSDISIGAFTSPTSQFALMSGANNANASVTQVIRHLGDTQCYVGCNAAVTSLIRRAQLDSWITNGFRLQWNEIFTQSSVVYWMVIKGGQWKVLSGTTATSLTTVSVAGTGFTVKGGMVFSHISTEQTADAVQSGGNLSLGCFDGPASRACHATLNSDNVATSEVAHRVEHDEVYANISSSGGILGLMDVQSLDGDGVTFVMDDADPSGSFFVAVMVGETGGGGGGGGGGSGPVKPNRISIPRQAALESAIV